MAIYAFGDLQGCYDELQELLDKIGPSSDDELWFVGDLVNRGPKSLKTLRYIHRLGNQAKCVLGNHDLHLLAVASGFSQPKHGDTLNKILFADDRDELLTWLGRQPLAHHDSESGFTMIHAGLPPQWSTNDAVSYSAEVSDVLNSAISIQYFRNMYGNEPNKWKNKLSGWERYRFITNCLTRLRYCTKKGKLAMQSKGPVGTQEKGLYPWFSLREERADERIVFGHWSAIGAGVHGHHENIISLDTGCVWGGKLTAAKLGDNPIWFQTPSKRAKTTF